MTVEKRVGVAWEKIDGVIGISTLEDNSGREEEVIFLTTPEILEIETRVRFDGDEYDISSRVASSSRLIGLQRYILQR